MVKPAPAVLNLRVAAIGLSVLLFGIGSVVFWILLADYLAWLLSFPERGCDKNVFRKSDYPGLLYEFVPNQCFNFYFGSRRLMKRYRPVSARINSHGFRGPEIGEKDGESSLRIMVLGDSVAFGAGVGDGDEFVRLVEKRWNLEGTFSRRIEIINTGVGGYNTTQEIASLERHQSRYRPDMVWLVVSLEDTIPWGSVVVKEDGTLFRPGAPFRFRLRSYAADFSGLFWWFNYAYRWRHGDGLIPPLFHPDFAGFQEWKKTIHRYAERIEKPSRSLVFLVPGNWKLDDYPWTSVHERIMKEIESCGLRCVDLLPAVQGLEMTRLWCHPLDQHPNELGHRLFAEYIAGDSRVVKHVRKRIEELESVRLKSKSKTPS